MALLPNIDFNVTNMKAINTKENDNEKLGLVPKFNFTKNDFVIEDGKIVYCTETEAVEQWIYLILQTYKDKYKVYKDTEFYCNVEDLTGKKRNGFVISELQREIERALKKHRYIKGIEGFKTTQDNTLLQVEFKVVLKDSSILNIKA